MNKEKLDILVENGDVDALSEELNFVRSMYRSGDITPAEYASKSALLESLIDKACDNQDDE